MPIEPIAGSAAGVDPITLGLRIRHFRVQRGLTLEQLGAEVGVVASQLSLIENGHREPRISLLTAVARALEVTVADLLSSAAPSPRAALEIELDRIQRGPLYGNLGLPSVRASRSLPDGAIEAIIGLHQELERRERLAIATPEEARRGNTELRRQMRTRNNYLPEIEVLAEKQVRDAGYTVGALTHQTVAIMAEKLGFTLIYVNDLPRSTRSVTDLASNRIYLPPASIPGGHGLRAMALQAMAHRLLGHKPPESYSEFLQQRLEINYFSACALMPETPSVAFLAQAKRDKNLAVEDFRDAFGVTHEAAALRMTNLLTQHLDLTLHFLRVTDDGAIVKAYENDDLRLPADVTGSIEGQLVPRRWGARRAFEMTNRTTVHYQYTDTPGGTFWCGTQMGTTAEGAFSITVGVNFNSAKWFRGRETANRQDATLSDDAGQREDGDLYQRWSGKAWPSARLHAHILSPLPTGSFPGVDDYEVYRFLERHAGR